MLLQKTQNSQCWTNIWRNIHWGKCSSPTLTNSFVRPLLSGWCQRIRYGVTIIINYCFNCLVTNSSIGTSIIPQDDDITGHATKCITIPNRKPTRRHIIDLVKSNLMALRKQLMVGFSLQSLNLTVIILDWQSDKVGLVSLTDNAWQAGNQDAYFAVTGHWNHWVSGGCIAHYWALRRWILHMTVSGWGALFYLICISINL